jgi:CubicO group peptidase (beta-lactamase class C family)
MGFIGLLLLLLMSGCAVTPIQQLLDKAAGGHFEQLHSLLVYKDGLLVVEQYYAGNNDFIEFENNITRNSSKPDIQWGRDQKHYVASVNKALTATLIGIALEPLGIGVKHKMVDFLPPQYNAYFNDKNLTIEDVLTMQAGFEWDEWGKDDLAQLWQSKDFTEFVLNRPNHGPKSEWRYNSALPNMLLRGLAHQLKQPIRQWADENFYAKLAITDYDWQSQPDGYPEGSARMFMRPTDMLKIGITYLNQGKWNNQQVIPKKWVDEIFKVQSTSAAGDYSYLFWLRELDGIRYLSADGDGGQYINIFPDQNMVIVMTQGNYLQWPVYSKQAEEIMRVFIGMEVP